MKRYENTKIKNDKNKNQHNYNTTFYSSIPETDDDIWVITQMGDRLDMLAHQFYGDVTLWWYIAKANALKDLRVESGLSIRIPGSTKFSTGR
tara:strand:- start:317 stop:592 length:276 start_codon:yes stop_codon:yes gene_type:complete